MTIFDPVGTVHAVFAALFDVGRAGGRSLPDSSRGSDPDVAGVLGKDKQLLPELTIEQAHALVADGTISGGMIPKVETCVAAVQGGVGASVILDGKLPHVMLLEIFTQRGVGTLFKRS